jgi:hypothetical protein
MNEIANIDYNTANIILKVNIGGKMTEIFLPPASQKEIKQNALVLGAYNNCMNNINANILLVDWDIYLEKCIKANVNEELGFNTKNDIYNKKVNEYKDKILGLLERSIVGGYYFETSDNGIEAKNLSSLSEDDKDNIRSSLLFFIAALRYWRPQMTDKEWAEALKASNINLTMLSAMEYKNTIMTQSKDAEISKE